MEINNQGIKCSVFLDTEVIIKKAVAKINETKDIRERQYYAQDILLEVGALMSCSNYNSKNQDCLNCHLVLLKYIQEYKNLAKDENKVKNLY